MPTHCVQIATQCSFAYDNFFQVVAASDFISSKHNMAMSMDKETYQLIKQHHRVSSLL